MPIIEAWFQMIKAIFSLYKVDKRISEMEETISRLNDELVVLKIKLQQLTTSTSKLKHFTLGEK